MINHYKIRNAKISFLQTNLYTYNLRFQLKAGKKEKSLKEKSEKNICKKCDDFQVRLFETETSWGQLKVGPAHLSGAKILVNHRGLITKKMPKTFCLTVSQHQNWWATLLVFLKVSGIEKFYAYGGYHDFSSKSDYLPVPKNFVKGTFTCLWVLARAIYRLYLNSLKIMPREKLGKNWGKTDNSLWL